MALSLTQLAVTPEEANAYAQLRGYSGWFEGAKDTNAALWRGQDYVAGRYNGRWASEWTETPEAVKFAIIEAAIREAAASGSLSPDYNPSSQVKREKVGPLETEYATPTSAAAFQPVFGIIDRLLSGLVGSGSGGANFRVSRG